MSDVVKSAEKITRFINQKNRFWKKEPKAKPAAFDPFPHQELSINRIDSCNENQIWDKGRQVVEEIQKKTLYGRADFWPTTYTKWG